MGIFNARILIALICAALSGSAQALETARSLAAAGAPHLALARVETLQPGDARSPRWGEWEALRLALLTDVGRHAEALKRAAALPASLPQPELRACLLAAMRAAVAAGQPAAARAHGARLLWQLEPTADEVRAARLQVIESYLAEQQGEAAFRAMLRFEQDYRPLERAVAARFVERLLDLGLHREAINWLAALEDAGPLKLRLRLHAGLVKPDAAIAQARLQAAKGDTDVAASRSGRLAWWKVLADAAEKNGDGTLRVEALEQVLNAGEGGAEGGPAAVTDSAAGLWQAYDREAQAAANQLRLLNGDDPAWLELAGRKTGLRPARARALLAWLARKGSAPETRARAQRELALSLQQGALERAALRLFAAERAETLDPQARHLLGRIGESRNEPALAWHFWQGSAAPSDVSTEEWQVRLAAVQWRAGMEAPALAALRALASPSKSLPEPAMARALSLAREMRDAGKSASAGEVYLLLLPLAGRGQSRDILFALGEIAESTAQPARSADFYLRAALADEARAADAPAVQARLAAAANLDRAGFREDARAQLLWVIANSRDARQIETARRRLSALAAPSR